MLARNTFRLFLCLGLLLNGLGAGAGEPPSSPRVMGLEDFFSIQRISDVCVSPDGKRVAYVVASASLEKNRVTSHVWILPPGEAPHRLTDRVESERSPCWSPDSSQVAFVSTRDGKAQVWAASIESGKLRQVTNIFTGASAPQWSPTGKHIAFTSRIWPGLSVGDTAQKERQQSLKDSDIQAQIFDHLLYRHWDSWRNGKRNHLFVVPAEGGEAKDVTRGDSDVLGGSRGYAFSPNGKEIAFTRGPFSFKTGSSTDVEAWSTNADIWVVPTEGGAPTCLTKDNPGWDGGPVWSPDGLNIAFRSQARDGYESDKSRLAVLERSSGKTNYHVSSELDRDTGEILWGPDSRTIYVGVEDNGSSAVFAFALEGLKAKTPPKRLLSGKHFTQLSIPTNGKFIVGRFQSLVRPAEIATLSPLTGPGDLPRFLVLTHHNDQLISQLTMPSVSSVRYPGSGAKKIQAWVLKPPDFRAGEGYPFILFIHGGPQGAWSDSFHFRWNLALFAARGFVIMAPNPHGSTGFGRELTEQISGDWAGACYEDVLKAADWAVEQGIADPARMAAMGGSFGGYMVNWILGHTDRFQALISHAGVYNLESMYGSTEELWFPEWDLRGAPWKNAECYEKFSPHRFAANFKTPTLVIHGQLDYRVPVTEGMQLFTALKRRGVEARFLYYPDEGHWVLKPKNSRLWVETCFDWLERYLKP